MKMRARYHLLISALVIALVAPALAEDAPIAPNPPPVDLPTYTLTLTPTEIAYIAQTLQRQPFADVAGLLNKIQSQIDEQRKSAQSKPTDSSKPEAK